MAGTRRQLRSTTVVLGGMGLLAAALTACSSEPDKRCVDRDSYNIAKGYKVVADKTCKTNGSVKVSGSAKSRRPVKTRIKVDAAWYYGGKKKNGWVDGGSFSKPGGSGGSGGSSSDDDSHHSGVHRGGFGGGKGSSGG
ncbi:hypothetical protein [Streptomyces sp. NPDC005209]|uniref:hypothetical protein n=1 Tax=Streptomyces sp. NPDC005209 TaxID=3156715 RepID=UPI0033B231E6